MRQIGFLRCCGGCFLAVVLLAESSSLFAGDYDKALSLREEGRYTEAMEELRRNYQTGDKKTLALLGKLSLDMNDFGRARAYYEKSCPGLNTAPCFNELGIVYMHIEKYKNARAAFAKAVEMEPGNSQYQSNLGLVWFYLRKKNMAQKHYNLALSIDPDNDVARMNHSVLLLRQGRYKAAEDELNRVLASGKKHYFACLYMGYALFRQKRYNESLEYFNKGLDYNPRFHTLYLYRAHAYFKLGAYGQAEYDLNVADQIKPGDAKAALLRNMIRRQRGY